MGGFQRLWIRCIGGAAFNIRLKGWSHDRESTMIWLDGFLIQLGISFRFRQSPSTSLDPMHTRRRI
jgi:hypothetical protein